MTLKPAAKPATLACPKCKTPMEFSWGLDLYYCETHGRQMTAQAVRDWDLGLTASRVPPENLRRSATKEGQ